jgi:hypothetical protein
MPLWTSGARASRLERLVAWNTCVHVCRDRIWCWSDVCRCRGCRRGVDLTCGRLGGVRVQSPTDHRIERSVSCDTTSDGLLRRCKMRAACSEVADLSRVSVIGAVLARSAAFMRCNQHVRLAVRTY